MAKAVIAHFTETFRSRHDGDQVARFEYLLRGQDAQIPPEAREKLEQLPTHEDKLKAAQCLNKLRSPGPDWVPVEFYITLWESIGHLLHRMLIEGILEGRFSLVFIRGVIVLLPKSGDFRLLNNRCPITLLNSMFKICSKHYQMFLAEVYIDFISPYQSAFIPGRTIHQALLLTIEVIHEA